jgi:hypothetical protein
LAIPIESIVGLHEQAFVGLRGTNKDDLEPSESQNGKSVREVSIAGGNQDCAP